jgi:predicted amidophosphoribosyltransferase
LALVFLAFLVLAVTLIALFKRCPYCRRLIPRRNIVCPRCTRDLPAAFRQFGQ